MSTPPQVAFQAKTLTLGGTREFQTTPIGKAMIFPMELL